MASAEARPSRGNPVFVDGDPVITDYLTTLWLEFQLPGHPYTVTTVEKDYFPLNPENLPSLILLQLGPRFGDPLDVIKGLKDNEQTKNIPILALGVNEQSELKKKLEDAGVNAVLDYNFEIDDFAKTVKEIISPPQE